MSPTRACTATNPAGSQLTALHPLSWRAEPNLHSKSSGRSCSGSSPGKQKRTIALSVPQRTCYLDPGALHLKPMRCATALPKGDGVPTSESSAAVENPRNGGTPAGNAPLPKSSPSAQLDAGFSHCRVACLGLRGYGILSQTMRAAARF